MSISIRRHTPLGTLLMSACLLAACDGEPGPITVELPPDAVFTVHGGDEQVGTASGMLPRALEVRVTSRGGRPVQGARILWRTGAGGGSVVAETTPSRTDSDGIARATRRLGSAAGAHRTIATVAELDLEVTFTSFAQIQGATQMRLVSGDLSTFHDTVRATNTLRVLLLDQDNQPVQGAVVSWNATAGTLASMTSATDANGIATMSHTHGSTAGAYQVYAGVAGLVGSPVPFYVHARAGNAVSLFKLSGDNQEVPAAALLAEPFRVQVTDAHGNAIGGASITWTMATDTGALLLKTELTHTVEVDGAPSVISEHWHQAGGALGEHTVEAVATTLPGMPSTGFTFTVLAAPPPEVLVAGYDWYCYWYYDCHEFSPASVGVPVGTKVTWRWVGAEDHNVVFEDDPTVPLSSTTKSTGTHTRTFATPGVYRYRCTLHSDDFTSTTAAGVVTVVE